MFYLVYVPSTGLVTGCLTYNGTNSCNICQRTRALLGVSCSTTAITNCISLFINS